MVGFTAAAAALAALLGAPVLTLLGVVTAPGARVAGLRVGGEAEVVSDDGVNPRAAPGTLSPILGVVPAVRAVLMRDGAEETETGSRYRVEYEGGRQANSAGRPESTRSTCSR